MKNKAKKDNDHLKSYTNKIVQAKKSISSDFLFTDNRPNVIIQKKLKHIVNNSSQQNRLNIVQKMANKSLSLSDGVIQRRPLNETEIKRVSIIKKNLFQKIIEYHKGKERINQFLDIFPKGLPTDIRYLQNRWETLGPTIEKAIENCDISFAIAKTPGKGGWNTTRFRKLNKYYHDLITSDGGLPLMHATIKTLIKNKPLFDLSERMNRYEDDRLQGAKRRNEEPDIYSGLIDREIKTDAVKDDDSRTVGLKGWVQIEDGGASAISDKDRGKMNHRKGWEAFAAGGAAPEGVNTKTKFMNIYKKEAIIILEFYRAPWKHFYASDAIFSQWLRALGNKKANAYDLPKKFPSVIYQNHIDNAPTIIAINNARGDRNSIEITKDTNEAAFNAISSSPNGKAMVNLLRSYNLINRARGGASYRLLKIATYGKAPKLSLKFEFGK